MINFSDPRYYGDWWAEVYDPLHDEYDPAMVEFLAKLAGSGSAMEFGIGTGRVALPLTEAGVRVHGVDISEPMVEQLRAKPGGSEIEVTMADLATVSLPEKFDVAYMVFNGMYCALTQEDQVAWFRTAARHLTDTGAFVIECFVPDGARFNRDQRIHILELTEDALYVEYSLHDPVEQRIRTQLVSFINGQAKLGPLTLRYATPSELDLMAQLASLKLEHRYADWSGSPFVAESTKHVSVYRPA